MLVFIFCLAIEDLYSNTIWILFYKGLTEFITEKINVFNFEIA